MSKKIKKILLKKRKRKIVSLTAYSKNFAEILDKYCDIILVGDSMANVVYGMKNTHQITLENIILCYYYTLLFFKHLAKLCILVGKCRKIIVKIRWENIGWENVAKLFIRWESVG